MLGKHLQRQLFESNNAISIEDIRDAIAEFDGDTRKSGFDGERHAVFWIFFIFFFYFPFIDATPLGQRQRRICRTNHSTNGHTLTQIPHPAATLERPYAQLL